MSSKQAESRAEQEFGSAKLEDIRRTERLKHMDRKVAERPMEREAAYRFLESTSIDQSQIAASISRASAERAVAYDYVFVGIDGTSLNFTDRKRTKGLGAIGSRKQGSVGVQVMSGLVVSPDGVPLGLSGIELWTRKSRAKVKGSRKHDRGGDAWPVLLAGFEPGRLLTVRTAYDRLLWESEEEP